MFDKPRAGNSLPIFTISPWGFHHRQWASPLKSNSLVIMNDRSRYTPTARALGAIGLWGAEGHRLEVDFPRNSHRKAE